MERTPVLIVMMNQLQFEGIHVSEVLCGKIRTRYGADNLRRCEVLYYSLKDTVTAFESSRAWLIRCLQFGVADCCASIG